MIWESGPWKKALWKIADRLEQAGRRRITEVRQVRIEQDVMNGAYLIRKLMDSHKLSREVVALKLKSGFYRRIGDRIPDLMNWHHIDRFYDLEGPPKDKPLGSRSFVNQVIHSYIFMLTADEDQNLNGILVTSDTMREKGLYQIDLTEMLRIFREVAQDDVVSARYTRGQDGQFVYELSRHGPSLEEMFPNGRLESIIQAASRSKSA
jgi:hypothetical protein